MGPFSRFFIHDPTPAAVLVVMGRCNVATTVFSSHRAIEEDASQGNDETARVVDHYPGKFAGYFVINPHQDPDGELLRWSEDDRFVGVKLHPDLHDYPITGRLYDRVLRWAAERGKPVLTHTWGGSALDDPAMLGRVCARIPDLTLIAGHSACHPPAARSCSWRAAPISRPTWALTPRTQARTSTAPTGFCFCGMVDDPPRPG